MSTPTAPSSADEHHGWLAQTTALVLLTYLVARGLPIPIPPFRLEIGALAWNLHPTAIGLAAVLAALMGANGAIALVGAHPLRPGRLARIEHALLPAFTAWLLSVPLARVPVGGVWAATLLLGGGMLALVIHAERITLDPAHPSYPLAVPLLTSLAFVLLLALTVTLRSTQARLLFQMVMVGGAMLVIALRTLHLALRRWEILPSLALAVLGTHMLVALYYLPLTALQSGLWLTAVMYPATLLSIRLLQGQPLRRAAWEPLIMLVVLGWLSRVLR